MVMVVRHTAEVEGCWAWVGPVVDFGVAIGLVVGFLLDVVLREGRGVVGGGNHCSCPCGCLYGGVYGYGSARRDGESRTRQRRAGKREWTYTWPRKLLDSPHEHWNGRVRG